MSGETEEVFMSDEERRAAEEFDVGQRATVDKSLEKENLDSIQAHRSWKEKIVDGLAHSSSNLVHASALFAAVAGSEAVAAGINPSAHEFVRAMNGLEHSSVSSPEQWLTTGVVMIGSAVVLEISNYIAKKIAEQKSLSNWQSRQLQPEMEEK